MKSTLLIALTLFTTASFANADLKLPGERWEAKSIGYRCAAYADDSSAPFSHDEFDVQFEYLRTDKTLDNGLVIATFTEEDSVCRYSAILLADNAKSTIKLVESKSYASQGSSECLEGKAIIDSQLKDNDYLYWGHPHHLTIMMPVESAQEVCGEGATHVGLDFLVSGFLGNRD